MKILVTGTKGLAKEIAEVFCDHSVTAVSKTTGHDILNIKQWGNSFLDYDCVFNCAYADIGQQLVLEYFYHNWQHDSTKTIVTIGSKVITQPRSEILQNIDYWPYRIHKQTLQNMHDNMWPTANCNLKIINPGPFDSEMTAHLTVKKLNMRNLAEQIRKITSDSVIKRVDLWL
jgi:hypothetical protein